MNPWLNDALSQFLLVKLVKEYMLVFSCGNCFNFKNFICVLWFVSFAKRNIIFGYPYIISNLEFWIIVLFHWFSVENFQVVRVFDLCRYHFN